MTDPITRQGSADVLVDDQWSNELLDEARQQSVVLQTMNVQRGISSKRVKYRVRAEFPEAQFVGEARTEPVSVTDDDTPAGDPVVNKPVSGMRWDNRTMTIEEIAVLVPVHEDVVADARDGGFNLDSDVQSACAEAIACRLDEAVLFGAAPQRPQSWGPALIPAAVAAGNVVTGGVLPDLAADFNAAMGLVEQDRFRPDTVVSSIALESALRGLRDDNGQPLYATSIKDDVMVNTIWGRRIAMDEFGIWDDDYIALVGARRYCHIGIREDISVQVSNQVTYTDPASGQLVSAFERDEVVLRFKFRVGYLVAFSARKGRPEDAFPFSVITAA
jgi:HK97 family phage major capsid protein